MPLHSARPRLRSTLATAAALLAVAAGAGACGADKADEDGDDRRGGSTSDTTEPVSGTLSADQVEQATITIDNLAGDWTEEPVDDDEDEDIPGCYGEINAITEDVDPVEKKERQFGYGERGLPQVNSKVSSYEDADEIAGLFDDVERGVEGCSNVVWEDDGYRYELDLRVLTDLPLDDIAIDDQFSFVASGSGVSLDDSSVSIPIYTYFTFVRVGPTVATIGSSGLEDVSAQQQAAVRVGATRLAAVVAGEEPEALLIEAP